jgi:hypothetical protein
MATETPQEQLLTAEEPSILASQDPAHQDVDIDAKLAAAGHSGAKGVWSFLLILSILVATILPLPWLRGWLDISISAEGQRWIAYWKYVSEILLVALFGGAIFTEQIGNSLEKACNRIAAKNKLKLANDKNLIKRLNRMATLGSVEHVTVKTLKTYFSDSLYFSLKIRSPLFSLRLLLLFVATAVPRGLYGILVFILVAIKILCDFLIMQNITSAT